MTRHEAIETLLSSKFEAWKIIPAMIRALFDHRYPDEGLVGDRNAIISVIADRLGDEQLGKLAQVFSGDPHPPIRLRRNARSGDLESAKARL